MFQKAMRSFGATYGGGVCAYVGRRLLVNLLDVFARRWSSERSTRRLVPRPDMVHTKRRRDGEEDEGDTSRDPLCGMRGGVDARSQIAMGAELGARVSGASALRQRRVHPEDAKGLLGDVRGGAPASGQDVYFAHPPRKPPQRFPLLDMVRDWCWKIGVPLWGALGFPVLEPNEWPIVGTWLAAPCPLLT